MVVDADTLVVLDIDHTILRSDRFGALVAEVLAELIDLDQDKVDAINNAILEGSGSAFDFLQWIRNYYGYQLPTPDVIASAMMARLTNHDDAYRLLMIDGTEDLLASLRADNMQLLLLTAGSRDLQLLKIIIIQKIVALLDGVDYAIVGDSHVKTALMAQCFTEAGFDIELLDAHVDISRLTVDAYRSIERVFVIDDKSKNIVMTERPEVIGILAKRDGVSENGRELTTMLDSINQTVLT